MADRDPLTSDPNCPCLSHGPKRPDFIEEGEIGTDPSEGRFAYVYLIRCASCSRLWIRYLWEVEACTASGQWCEAPIEESAAATMSPEVAYRFIMSRHWRIVGGSFYGHGGDRVAGQTQQSAAPEHGNDPATFRVLYAKHMVILRLLHGEPAMFFNRRTLRWHAWPGPIPAPARPITQADAWRSIYEDSIGLDFGTLDRPQREWPQPAAG
jgi:hypothetical protein